MLTKRKNFLETIRGGRPDRFVNQYEAFRILYNPVMMHSPMPSPGDLYVVNDWRRGFLNSATTWVRFRTPSSTSMRSLNTCTS